MEQRVACWLTSDTLAPLSPRSPPTMVLSAQGITGKSSMVIESAKGGGMECWRSSLTPNSCEDGLEQNVPRISIAMATYNGAKYIAEQVRSIARQTFQPYELVIGDDGSSDSTLSIVAEIAPTLSFPVRVQKNAANLGFGENFLQTASRCSGDWIAFSDQDDYWCPQKLERVSQAIMQHAGCDLVLIGHQVEVADENLLPLGRRPAWFRWQQATLLRRSEAHGFWCLGGCSMIFRSSLIKDFPWDERPIDETVGDVFGWRDLRVPHDRWISLLANALGSTALLSDTLGLFRRHGAAVTGTNAPQVIGAEITQALRTGPDFYRKRQRAAFGAASTLRRLASCTDEERAALLLSGADDFERLASVHASRARVQQLNGRLRRLRCVARLLRGRGYFGHPFSSAGPRALIKDVYFALVG